MEFYTFVADNYAPFYSLPIECTDRDAAFVLDGLLYNESELGIEEHYTDTHGYTEINFAAFAMLGLLFCPRKEKALGPEHPDVATSLNNLAGFYHNQGQYAKAEPLYQRALAIWEKALGPEHPDVARSLNNWLRNARGEWFVIAQTALMLAVLVAPKLDGQKVFWSGITGVVGGLLCVVGLGFVVLGSIALGRNLSPFPKPKEKGTLVESGIFSVVRHPIYSGLSLAAFGWSLIWNSIAALVAAFLLLAFFDIKARREERWLEEKFPGYAAYKSRVKKFIPFVY